MHINVKDLENEKNYQEKVLLKLLLDKEKLPEGSLCYKKIKGKNYIYCQTLKSKRGRPGQAKNGKRKEGKRGVVTSKCIKKNEMEIAENIKRYQFAKRSIPILRQNIKAMDRFLMKYVAYNPGEILESMPEVYRGVAFRNTFSLETDEATRWSDMEEDTYDKYTFDLKHTTTKGRLVRSKSEAIIAELLETNGITFKYETKITVNGKNYYPDFAILRKEDNEILYWEHFGLMNNEEYVQKMFRKIADYQQVGILLWDNLVITTESEDGNIDVRTIDRIIKKFML